MATCPVDRQRMRRVEERRGLYWGPAAGAAGPGLVLSLTSSASSILPLSRNICQNSVLSVVLPHLPPGRSYCHVFSCLTSAGRTIREYFGSDESESQHTQHCGCSQSSARMEVSSMGRSAPQGSALPYFPGQVYTCLPNAFVGVFPSVSNYRTSEKLVFSPTDLFSGIPCCPPSLGHFAVAFRTTPPLSSRLCPSVLPLIPPGSLLSSAEASSGSPPSALYDSDPSLTLPQVVLHTDEYSSVFYGLICIKLVSGTPVPAASVVLPCGVLGPPCGPAFPWLVSCPSSSGLIEASPRFWNMCVSPRAVPTVPCLTTSGRISDPQSLIHADSPASLLCVLFLFYLEAVLLRLLCICVQFLVQVPQERKVHICTPGARARCLSCWLCPGQCRALLWGICLLEERARTPVCQSFHSSTAGLSSWQRAHRYVV